LVALELVRSHLGQGGEVLVLGVLHFLLAQLEGGTDRADGQAIRLRGGPSRRVVVAAAEPTEDVVGAELRGDRRRGGIGDDGLLAVVDAGGCPRGALQSGQPGGVGEQLSALRVLEDRLSEATAAVATLARAAMTAVSCSPAGPGQAISVMAPVVMDRSAPDCSYMPVNRLQPVEPASCPPVRKVTVPTEGSVTAGVWVPSAPA
jgi:hypothetical protein